MGAEDPNTEARTTLDICCPRCGKRDITLTERGGYFWVHSCNNCGYRGKEGETVGCII